ncbi:hypothetical protein ACJZ2D_008580 [Fusarium nematophilum]
MPRSDQWTAEEVRKKLKASLAVCFERDDYFERLERVGRESRNGEFWVRALDQPNISERLGRSRNSRKRQRSTPSSELGAASRLSQSPARPGRVGDDAPADGDAVRAASPTSSSSTGALTNPISVGGKFPNIEERDVDDVKATLEKWQSIGVKRLDILAKWQFKGGFLCDSPGMGKSLTALVAAVEIRKSMLPNCGFILVVCPPGRARQWQDEVKWHFCEDARPSILWLKSASYPIESLLQYDIVICTSGFLRRCHDEKMRHELQCLSIDALGAEWTLRIFGDTLERPRVPLHSTYYDMISRNIAVLIVDEAHAAKHENSKLSEAIRTLKYHHALLLTGTPIYTNPKDFGSMLMLLPNPPFASASHFCDMLGTGTMPDILEKLVAALVLARPKTAPDPIYLDVSVSLDGRWGTVLAISQLTSDGGQLLRSTMSDDDEMSKRGLALIATAQRLAASSLLLEARAIAQDIDPESGPGRHNLVAYIGDSIQAVFLQWLEVANKDRSLLLDEMDYDTFRDFEQFWESHRRRQRSDLQGLNAASVGDVSVSGRGLVAHDEDTFYDAEEFVNLPTPVNEGWDADEPDIQTSVRHRARLPGRSHPEFTQRWLKRLSTATDEEIFSPRVKAIVEQVRQMRRGNPNLKTLVVSRFVMFLDILKEAMIRLGRAEKAFRFDIAEYNGTVACPEARSELASRFNENESGTDVMLLSAAAYGPGLNLCWANAVIIPEPLWTPELDDQIVGVANRTPRDLPTEIYDVAAPLSAVDEHIFNRARQERLSRYPYELPGILRLDQSDVSRK